MTAKHVVIALMLRVAWLSFAESLVLHVDLDRTNGVVRRLHGLNKGPMATGGMIDLTPRWRELAPPLTRLHDCQWPYPDVVDVHAIFRDPSAAPEKAENYDWALTDAYLSSIRATGAEIVYRLGESIEHGPVKRFVHPPADFERWAKVCCGIIRHYNEGWAKGTRYGIRYWEIWNEPENRPAMWSGSDEEYIRLYRTAALMIKKEFPTVMVGGPALGYSGKFESGRFMPSEFTTNFVASCRRDEVRLDFFSWHCYTSDPSELSARARAIRELLNACGFRQTESHLNEWNYLPENSWEAFSQTASPELRRRFYERMSGAEGAAFVATALIELQDAPVDVSNFYHGELGGFGLFDEHGAPNRVYEVMRAFGRLARMDSRADAKGGLPGKVAVLAARQRDGHNAAVLISNFQTQTAEFQLRVSGIVRAGAYKVFVTNSREAWHEAAQGKSVPGENIRLELPAPAVALIEFTP